MSRRVVSAGGLLTAGLALLLSGAAARAGDPCGCGPCGPFAFFRRCPPEAGANAAAASHTAHLCHRVCHPYCDPNFGFYPTAWRAWPTLYCGAGEFPAVPAPAGAAPAATPPANGAPPTMPPASDGDASRRPQGSPPVVRTAVSGASVR